jgi:hypothetical protein
MVVILSQLLSKPKAKWAVTALYVVLMGCVFAFLTTVIMLK